MIVAIFQNWGCHWHIAAENWLWWPWYCIKFWLFNNNCTLYCVYFYGSTSVSKISLLLAPEISMEQQCTTYNHWYTVHKREA